MFWGSLGTSYRAVVLKFIAPDIMLRHKNLISQGLTHGHDSFIPHMSLKYKPDSEDIKILENAFFAIKKRLNSIKFSDEYSEKLES